MRDIAARLHFNHYRACRGGQTSCRRARQSGIVNTCLAGHLFVNIAHPIQSVKRAVSLLGDIKPASLALEVTAASLALESMVSLAQNGNVFKEAIRNLDGFDIVHNLMKKGLLLLDMNNVRNPNRSTSSLHALCLCN